MKVVVLLLSIALLCSLIGWYSEHKEVSATIERQAQAITDQNVALKAVFSAMGKVHSEDYVYMRQGILPPRWAEVEVLPGYLNAKPEIKAKILGEWLNQNFMAYHETCGSLSKDENEAKALLKEGVDSGKGMLQYSDTLEERNKELRKSLALAQFSLAKYQDEVEADKIIIGNLNTLSKYDSNTIREMAEDASRVNRLVLAIPTTPLVMPAPFHDPQLDQELSNPPSRNFTILKDGEITHETVISDP